MQKKLAAAGVIAFGVLVVVVVFVNNLFTVAPAFEDMTDGFRPVMTDPSIATAQQDVAGLAAVNVEFSEMVVPAMSQALQMTPDQFNAFVAQQFPSVAAGVSALPQIVPQFTGVVDLLADQQANFEKADALPMDSAPATTLPWLILLIGVAAIVVGIVMLFKARLGAILAVVLGVLVVASSLALSFIPKANAADDMNTALKPTYNAELIAGSDQALLVIEAMGTQMQTAMLPALGQQLGMDQVALEAFLGQNFPATAQALQTLPDSLGRFKGMVGVFSGQLGNYETIQDTALSPIAWIVLLSGIAVALLGLLALIAGGRKTTSIEATVQKATAPRGGAGV